MPTHQPHPACTHRRTNRSPAHALGPIKRRWDAIAIDQLRAELARLDQENRWLREDNSRLQREVDSAQDCAHAAEAYRMAVEFQLASVEESAQHAGLALSTPRIGITPDAQFGLVAGVP